MQTEPDEGVCPSNRRSPKCAARARGEPKFLTSTVRPADPTGPRRNLRRESKGAGDPTTKSKGNNGLV